MGFPPSHTSNFRPNCQTHTPPKTSGGASFQRYFALWSLEWTPYDSDRPFSRFHCGFKWIISCWFPSIGQPWKKKCHPWQSASIRAGQYMPHPHQPHTFAFRGHTLAWHKRTCAVPHVPSSKHKFLKYFWLKTETFTEYPTPCAHITASGECYCIRFVPGHSSV